MAMIFVTFRPIQNEKMLRMSVEKKKRFEFTDPVDNRMNPRAQQRIRRLNRRGQYRRGD